MKAKILVVWLFLAVTALLYAMQQKSNTIARPQSQQKPLRQAQIDLAFCLDTTGSMSGLIEGAKQKIWSIVNTVAGAQPRPQLRIGLVAYRDIGDAYVTKVFPFTGDLETMYSQLQQLAADGGGDTPESVNRALDEAVGKLDWRQNSAALKILYLVGDAPPHMDYHDQYNYHDAARRAAGSGIIINTIRCGQMAETQLVWQEIARLADGKYASIDQSGGMITVNSPYDRDLARLSSELNSTYVPYGREGDVRRVQQLANDEKVAVGGAAPAAERAVSKSSSLYRNDSWDLVDALKLKNLNLEDLKKDDLPKELRDRSVGEQRKYLQVKSEERGKIQQQIQDINKKREAYVAKETSKLGAKAKDAFDAQVLGTLKDQGKQKGISFNH